MSSELPDVVIRELIHLVEERPALWDLQKSDYRNINRKKALWEEIAAHIKLAFPSMESIDGGSIRKTFDMKRRTFRAELQKKTYAKSGQPLSESYVGKWRFFRDMAFLAKSCQASMPSVTREASEDFNLEDSVPIPNIEAGDLNTASISLPATNNFASTSGATPLVEQPQDDEPERKVARQTPPDVKGRPPVTVEFGPSYAQRTDIIAQLPERLSMNDTMDNAAHFGGLVTEWLRTLTEQQMLQAQIDILQVIQRYKEQ